MSSIKERITTDLKDAMRAKDARKLTVLRSITAAIKQMEVDQRIAVEDDALIIGILDKLVKQRKESLAAFQGAGRVDLAEQEQYEINILTPYLPEPLSEDELAHIIQQAILEAQATKISDMGKVMAMVKPLVQGRADMAKVSLAIKNKLA